MSDLMNKYYDYPKNKDKVSKAEKIVFDILEDIKDRGGLGNSFDSLDEDIQQEILECWIESTEKHI